MIQQRARCDACGFASRVVTGWVEVTDSAATELRLAGLDHRIRVRGGVTFYRRRLRDVSCPRCSQRTLHAARVGPQIRFGTADEAIGTRPRRMS